MQNVLPLTRIQYEHKKVVSSHLRRQESVISTLTQVKVRRSRKRGERHIPSCLLRNPAGCMTLWRCLHPWMYGVALEAKSGKKTRKIVLFGHLFRVKKKTVSAHKKLLVVIGSTGDEEPSRTTPGIYLAHLVR